MAKKTDSQIAETVDRFRRVFWEKAAGGRPPVGVLNANVWLPVKYLRRPLQRDCVEPDDVRTDTVMTDYEFGFVGRPVVCDDFVPFAAPWRAIPWLEAWCGCTVRWSDGSLAPQPNLRDVGELGNTLPARPEWFECMGRLTEILTRDTPHDCWVSPTILRGPSDVIAAMRGLPQFMCDLYDAPGVLETAVQEISRRLLLALERHFRFVPPKLGGYGHIFGYWAPGPTIAIQEDVMGLCRPTFYREIFKPCNEEIVRRLGAHVLFHLHSTGIQHYRDVLSIPGLGGLELTIEANGPPIKDLLPVMREALDTSRLVLVVDNRLDELAGVLPQLPCEGLYIVVPESYLPNEREFCDFVKRWWGRT